MRALRIGLTGGIATGKSTVLKELARLGAETVSTDELAHELLAEPRIAAKIARRFGRGVLDSKGRVDRKALGRHVFHRPGELHALERLLHPGIRKRAAARLAKSRKRIRVVDVPLLFEKGMEKDFDLTLLVYASPADQSRRLRAREKMGRAEALRRIALQWPIGKKADRADVVLDNRGAWSKVRRLVREYFRAFELIAHAG